MENKIEEVERDYIEFRKEMEEEENQIGGGHPTLNNLYYN